MPLGGPKTPLRPEHDMSMTPGHFQLFHLGHLLALRREQLLPGLLSLGAGLDPLDQVLHQLHPASHPVLGVRRHVLCVRLPQGDQLLLDITFANNCVASLN